MGEEGGFWGQWGLSLVEEDTFESGQWGFLGLGEVVRAGGIIHVVCIGVDTVEASG
jgi:hypothetical protein